MGIQRSDLRWCSDSLEIKCDSGQTVNATFADDYCDREVMAWRDWEGKCLPGERLCARCSSKPWNAASGVPDDHALEYLSDNGGVYIAAETWALASALGLKPINTPVCSPQQRHCRELSEHH